MLSEHPFTGISLILYVESVWYLFRTVLRYACPILSTLSKFPAVEIKVTNLRWMKYFTFSLLELESWITRVLGQVVNRERPYEVFDLGC